jgi:sugar-specific transcriptional regulator TrmB
MDINYNNQFVESLTSIGLNENEARLYLAGLELGPTTILKLSKSASVKRTTAYSIIESLIAKGIFYIQMDGWKKYFVASDPDNLEQIAYRNYKNTAKFIPNLISKYTKEKKQSVLNYYAGKDSIEKLYDSILESLEKDSDYFVIGNQEMWINSLGEYSEKFVRQRYLLCRDLNIKVKALMIKSKYSLYQQERQKSLGMEIKLLPDDSFLTTNCIFTSKITVFHQLVGDELVFETNNEHINQTQRQMFDLLWLSIP